MHDSQVFGIDRPARIARARAHFSRVEHRGPPLSWLVIVTARRGQTQRVRTQDPSMLDRTVGEREDSRRTQKGRETFVVEVAIPQ
jgi:hypothetical protein